MTRFGFAVAAIVGLLDQALKLWLIFVFDLGNRGIVRLLPRPLFRLLRT